MSTKIMKAAMVMLVLVLILVSGCRGTASGFMGDITPMQISCICMGREEAPAQGRSAGNPGATAADTTTACAGGARSLKEITTYVESGAS